MGIKTEGVYTAIGLLAKIREQERLTEKDINDGNLLIKILMERVEYNAGIIKMLDDMYKESLQKKDGNNGK